MVKVRVSVILLNVLLSMLFLVSGCATTKGDWQRTSQNNTVETYQEFIRKHPHSNYAYESQKRIERLKRKDVELAWGKVKNADTVEAYTDFIQKYPRYYKNEVYLRLKTLIKEQLRKTKNVRVKIGKPFEYVKSIDCPGFSMLLNTPGTLRPITGCGSHPDYLVKASSEEKQFLKKELRQLVESVVKQHGYNLSKNSKTTLLVLYIGKDNNSLPSVCWRDEEIDGISKNYKLKFIIIAGGQTEKPIIGIENDYSGHVFEKKTNCNFSFEALKENIREILGKKCPLEIDENSKLSGGD